MEKEPRAPSLTERRRTPVVAPASLSDPGRRIGPVWLSVAQLGRRWQLSRKTTYKFIDTRILPAWKVGPHLYRVAVEDVVRFEAQAHPVRSGRTISFPPKRLGPPPRRL